MGESQIRNQLLGVAVALAATGTVAYFAHRAGFLKLSAEREESDDEDDGYDSEDPAEEDILGEQLIDAAKRGDLQEVQQRLAEGAIVGYQSKGTRRHTRIGLLREQGQTALHWAAIRGEECIATILCDSGARVDTADVMGQTPLMLAVYNNKPDVIELFCKPGTPGSKTALDMQDGRGWSAFHWCVQGGGSMQILRLLKDAGCNSNLRDNEGDTAGDRAGFEGYSRAAQFLGS